MGEYKNGRLGYFGMSGATTHVSPTCGASISRVGLLAPNVTCYFTCCFWQYCGSLFLLHRGTLAEALWGFTAASSLTSRYDHDALLCACQVWDRPNVGRQLCVKRFVTLLYVHFSSCLNSRDRDLRNVYTEVGCKCCARILVRKIYVTCIQK